MATETKVFETISVLTVVTGRVLTTGGIGGVYEVLNLMTGEACTPTNCLAFVGRPFQSL